MNKKQKSFGLLLLLSLLITVGLFVKRLGPYGENCFPQWIEKGNVIVEAIGDYKSQHQSYPKVLPIDPKCQDIPGCREVEYVRNVDKKGKEYFRLTIAIHIREAVMYDSRKNLSESNSWGTYKILDDWVWTKD